MKPERLRAVGPWKAEHKPEIEERLLDPVMALVAELIDSQAQIMEEMARVLRSDAERVRRLG